MKYQITVVGTATWDIFFTTPEARAIRGGSKEDLVMAFPYGGKVDATDVRYGFGGGAANVAVGLANLGVHSRIVTRLGSDWRGSEVVRNFNKHGVETSFVQLDKKKTTALSLVITGGGARDHVAFVDRGASLDLRLPASALKKSQWLYVTSLAMTKWNKVLGNLLRQARQDGVKVFWNPGSTQIVAPKKMAKLLPMVDILDLNLQEARRVAQELGLHEQSPKALATSLLSLGSRLVLITAGEKGAYCAAQGKVYFKPTKRIKPVNTTGAGDAFGSGFLAGYLNSQSVETALSWGMVNSGSVIQAIGAQRGLLTKQELISKL